MTPQDIREKTFEKAMFGGYDMAAVQNYQEEVATELANAQKEIARAEAQLANEKFVSRAPAVEIPDSLRSLWLPAHASLSLLAYDCFALAAVGGLMYLLQERNIKRKRFGLLYSRLPDLETLDRLGLHCLSVGFPLLTLGMITGSLWAWRAFGSYWRWNATEVWTLAVWLIYAALFHQRLTVGWRGRRAAWLAIGALALALFAFWGVTAFFSGYHGNFS